MNYSFESEESIDLDQVYRSFESLFERSESSLYSTVVKNFGDTEQDDIFIQADSYNMFLFEDGAVFTGDLESLEDDSRTKRVLEQVYNEEDICESLSEVSI